MKILYSADFRKEFYKLPAEIQAICVKQEKIFIENRRDYRLHIKKLKGDRFVFSFRITRNYRVLFMLVDSQTALFATIGHRKDIYR